MCVVDGADDVTQGSTKGNSGIVHAGPLSLSLSFSFSVYVGVGLSFLSSHTSSLGFVIPYEFAIAVAENAADNGVEVA